MLRNEGDKLLRVVVCTPKSEYFNVGNCSVHNITQFVYQDKTKQQHNKLKSILRGFGCEVIDIPEFPNHPNSVFTRDTSLCTPNGYIKLRMGLDTRIDEEVWMARILESLGEPNVGSIEIPGTVEGGDVILAGSVAFVGHSQRTNENGVEQISSLLEAMRYEVRSITVPAPYLHIGGAMSIIGPECILCCRGIFPDDFFDGFDKVEVISNTFVSGNVICLGDNEVIADISNVQTIKELRRAGIIVHAIDLSEFVKGTGGASCLIMPVERK